MGNGEEFLYTGRTLIVDDMEDVYEKLKNKFKDSTYAKTVEKGLEEIASDNYKLVITDWDLGEYAPQGGGEIIIAAKNRGLDCILMSKEYHGKEAEKLGTRFIFKKVLLESKNIRGLIKGDGGRK